MNPGQVASPSQGTRGLRLSEQHVKYSLFDVRMNRHALSTSMEIKIHRITFIPDGNVPNKQLELPFDLLCVCVCEQCTANTHQAIGMLKLLCCMKI